MRVRLGPRTGPAHACRAGSRYGTSTPCLAVAGEGVEVYLQAAEVGSAQVVDGDDVSAAEGFEVDLLDAGNVHRHVADVADEAQAVSIRGQVDPLGEVGSDERHRVVRRSALRAPEIALGLPCVVNGGQALAHLP